MRLINLVVVVVAAAAAVVIVFTVAAAAAVGRATRMGSLRRPCDPRECPACICSSPALTRAAPPSSEPSLDDHLMLTRCCRSEMHSTRPRRRRDTKTSSSPSRSDAEGT